MTVQRERGREGERERREGGRERERGVRANHADLIYG